MIEQLTGLPDGILGFEAVGTVHGGDYLEVMVPAVAAAAEQGEVRLVYVLGDRFDGYSAGAAWEDTKFGFEHLKSFQRTALVTDVGWVTHVAGMFGWMVPGEFRHFALAERDAAVEWAAG